MKVAIIGAGFTGLSAGYYLAEKGVKVEIFEKESVAGGLAAGFKKKSWDWSLENFFHHLFPSDKALFDLACKLDITDKIFFCRSTTSIYFNGQTHPFDSPSSLLKFPHLSLPEKLKMGASLAFFKFNPLWQPLEKITAVNLLSKLMGEKAYQLLWQPLFTSKFGGYADQISAAWFWARIKKRSPKLGYLEGGFQTLADVLAKKIQGSGNQIHLTSTISNIHPDMAIAVSKSTIKFDKVLVTTPIPIFLKMAPKLGLGCLENLRNLAIIGAVNLVLELKEPFLANGTYWLNINDSSFPFCAVVEHTNFIDKKYYGGNHIVYVGGYYPANHKFFQMTKKELLKVLLPYLRKINPDFSWTVRQLADQLVSYQLFKNPFAQPIIPINYSKIKPSIKTPIANLFLATLHHVYPWDRGVNYAIKLGKEAADEIIKS